MQAQVMYKVSLGVSVGIMAGGGWAERTPAVSAVLWNLTCMLHVAYQLVATWKLHCHVFLTHGERPCSRAGTGSRPTLYPLDLVSAGQGHLCSHAGHPGRLCRGHYAGLPLCGQGKLAYKLVPCLEHTHGLGKDMVLMTAQIQHIPSMQHSFPTGVSAGEGFF